MAEPEVMAGDDTQTIRFWSADEPGKVEEKSAASESQQLCTELQTLVLEVALRRQEKIKAEFKAHAQVVDSWIQKHLLPELNEKLQMWRDWFKQDKGGICADSKQVFAEDCSYSIYDDRNSELVTALDFLEASYQHSPLRAPIGTPAYKQETQLPLLALVQRHAPMVQQCTMTWSDYQTWDRRAKKNVPSRAYYFDILLSVRLERPPRRVASSPAEVVQLLLC